MTIKELRDWLSEEITKANLDASESHKAAINSYGAGHDRGFADALERVELKLNDELDT